MRLISNLIPFVCVHATATTRTWPSCCCVTGFRSMAAHSAALPLTRLVRILRQAGGWQSSEFFFAGRPFCFVARQGHLSMRKNLRQTGLFSALSRIATKKPTRLVAAWASIVFRLLVQQSHQRCLRLLLYRQHLPEVGLRRSERGLLVFL